MKYRAMDGYELEAESLQQVAEKLWQSMLNPDATLEEWMAGSARRAAIYNGSVISTASVEEHVRAHPGGIRDAGGMKQGTSELSH